MAKKTPRPRAETPRGFRDAMGEEVAARGAMLARVAEVYRLHGFDPLETSAVETVEALGSFLPDLDRPNAGVFGFLDDDTWLALRYDLTAPLARVVAQHREALPSPYRRYAMGPVWRNEKPGPGRYRQFYQCDADTVGSAAPAADAEICAMLAEALEAAGIARGDYLVRIGDRRVLNGAMDAAGIAEGEEATRGAVLRAIDKLDRLGTEGVRALLGEGRRDESGDETLGAGLSDDQAETIMAFATARGAGAGATLARLREVVGGTRAGAEGLDGLEAIGDVLAALGLGEGRATIDPAVVRGLGYYTGPVFEAELTFETPGEDGRPRRFGSVAGGGRYDDLVRRFTGQSVPATGVSIGVDRLLAALATREALAGAAAGPVVVTVMDRGRMAEAMAMAAELRAAGIRAEAYLGNPKSFGNQLKYADRRGAPVAVIQGPDEAARGAVQLKDLALGARLAATATLDEWKGQPAQSEVPRGELVAGVRAILDRAR